MSASHGSSSVAGLVEKQMRNWEISRAQCRDESIPKPGSVADFVTIANIVGAGGREVAELLGKQLNWPVFDRQILSEMSGDDDVRTRLYKSMDERDLGWLENTCRSFMDVEFRRNDYFHRLCETLLCLARQGSAIYVGRSADLILPRDKGVRVKLVATLKRCAANFAERNHVSVEKARSEIARIEQERTDFVWNHFHIDAYDSTRFDILVNVERFSTQQAVDLIVSALGLRRKQSPT